MKKEKLMLELNNTIEDCPALEMSNIFKEREARVADTLHNYRQYLRTTLRSLTPDRRNIELQKLKKLVEEFEPCTSLILVGK